MNKELEQLRLREEFKLRLDNLLEQDLDDAQLKIEIIALVKSSKIDIKYPYKDTIYEDLLELVKTLEPEKFKYKGKKVYKDEYEAQRDYKLNIFKKNVYARPYYQEKKRRNSFNFNRSKKKKSKS